MIRYGITLQICTHFYSYGGDPVGYTLVARIIKRMFGWICQRGERLREDKKFIYHIEDEICEFNSRKKMNGHSSLRAHAFKCYLLIYLK